MVIPRRSNFLRNSCRKPGHDIQTISRHILGSLVVFAAAIITISVSIIFTSCSKVTCEVAWEKTYGAGEAYTVEQTLGGGYAICGYSEHRGWFAKMDDEGNLMWEHSLGASGPVIGNAFRTEEIYSFQQTSDEGYILCCSSWKGDINDFDASKIITSLKRIDEKGNLVWEKVLREQDFGTEQKVHMAQTIDNGYILGINWPGNAGLMKIDSEGNALWEKHLDSENEMTIAAIAVTSQGGYILAGSRFYPPGVTEIVLMETDNYGNPLWEKAFQDDWGGSPQSMIPTSDGGYALAGRTNDRAWLAKVDGEGEVLWGRYYGEKGKGADFASLEQTPDGGYVLAGSIPVPREERRKAWFVKTDARGNVVCDTSFDEQHVDASFSSIALTSDGGCILAGKKKGSWVVKIAIR
jgi:hypothetical protein